MSNEFNPEAELNEKPFGCDLIYSKENNRNDLIACFVYNWQKIDPKKTFNTRCQIVEKKPSRISAYWKWSQAQQKLQDIHNSIQYANWDTKPKHKKKNKTLWFIQNGLKCEICPIMKDVRRLQYMSAQVQTGNFYLKLSELVIQRMPASCWMGNIGIFMISDPEFLFFILWCLVLWSTWVNCDFYKMASFVYHEKAQKLLPSNKNNVLPISFLMNYSWTLCTSALVTLEQLDWYDMRTIGKTGKRRQRRI